MIVEILLTFMVSLLASRDAADLAHRRELAVAIAAVTDDPQEAFVLAKIARYESAYRRDVATCAVHGPQGELGAWQVLPRSDDERRELCVSYEADARLALERLRESVNACRRLPEAERLAVYARGRCSSTEGRRLSRVRWVYLPKGNE